MLSLWSCVQSGTVSSADIRSVLGSLLTDDTILKVGFGLPTDLNLLYASYPSLWEALGDGVCKPVLDVCMCVCVMAIKLVCHVCVC